VNQSGSAPSGVGTYRDGSWLLDVDADGNFNAVVDRSFNLGFPGATHFVGEIVPNLVEGGRAAVLKLCSLRESSKPFTFN
jgi:hypothetical protein